MAESRTTDLMNPRERGSLALASAEVRVLVPVRRRAAAEETERPVGRGADLVPGSRRNQDRVAGRDPRALAVHLHLADPLEQEVHLLGLSVVVALRGLPGVERRLGQALITDGRRRKNRSVTSARDLEQGYTLPWSW